MEINNINTPQFSSRRACHVPKNDGEMFRKFRNLVARQFGGQCPELLIGDVYLEEGQRAKMFIWHDCVGVEPPHLYKSAIAKFRDNFFEFCTKGKKDNPHIKSHKKSAKN